MPGNDTALNMGLFARFPLLLAMDRYVAEAEREIISTAYRYFLRQDAERLTLWQERKSG